MNDKEKIFGSPSDYPFNPVGGHIQKVKRLKTVTKSNRFSSGPHKKMNGFQRQVKQTKYKISRRIAGSL